MSSVVICNKSIVFLSSYSFPFSSASFFIYIAPCNSFFLKASLMRFETVAFFSTSKSCKPLSIFANFSFKLSLQVSPSNSYNLGHSNFCNAYLQPRTTVYVSLVLALLSFNCLVNSSFLNSSSLIYYFIWYNSWFEFYINSLALVTTCVSISLCMS